MARKFFINLDAPDPATALVESFTSQAIATNPTFIRDDDFEQELHFLRRNPVNDTSRPFVYVDADAEFSQVILSVGVIDARPDSGTFTLTDTAAVQTTAAIAYNASAATVQAAIRAALTTNWSVAVVTAGDTDSTWSIDRGAVGLIPALTATTAALVPVGSDAIITRTNVGDASTDGVQFLELVRAAAIGFGDTWTALPSATVTPAIIQAGSASANKIYSVSWNSNAYDGAVWLSVLADAVTTTVGPIEFDALADDVVTAFEAHSGIEVGEVLVTRDAPGEYTITFSGGSLANSNAPTISTSANTLSVPLGLTAQLSADTAGVVGILNGASSATATIEIEVTETGGQTYTPVQDTDCTIKADLIRNTPTVSSALERFVTVNSSDELTSPTSITVPATLGIGIAGVTMTGADGVLTITGAGTGSDESMIINLDDVANTIGFTSGTGATNWDFATSVTTELFLTDVSGGGSATAPAFSRSTDTNTGMYFSGTDEVAITTGGTRRVKVSSIDVDFAVPIEVPDSTVGAPAIRSDGATTTGISFPSNTIVLGISGTARATITGSGLTLGSGNTLTADNISSTNITAGTVVQGTTNLNLASQSNGNINLAPHGSGRVVITGEGFKVLASDETRTSTVAFTDLTGMTQAVTSGETWQFDVLIIAKSLTLASGGGGAAVKLEGPSATYNMGQVFLGPTSANHPIQIFTGTTTNLYQQSFSSHSNDDTYNGISFRFTATILFSASGTFSLQASQLVSDSDATTFVRGSYFKATRL